MVIVEADRVARRFRFDEIAAQRFEAFERAFFAAPSAVRTPPHRRRRSRRDERSG
jgi:uncharacterized membrane protein